jgi:hypothetical protein
VTVLALLVAAGALVAGLGHADADGPRPWAQGISAERQEEANALFEEGNQLFGQQAHGPALERYRAAAALWGHPMIHFNMAVTEIKLDRILDAALDLERALRFGREPFLTPELYEQALDYQRLLRGRIGELHLTCEQPDVKIEVDGQPRLACPGRRRLRVLAGEHVVVGERAGYLPRSARLVVGGGAVVVQRIQLLSLEAATFNVYPYPRWIPWTVTGGGAAILLGGLGLYVAGKNQLADFHSAFASECADGCEADLADRPLLRGARDGALWKGKVAAATMWVGGATAAGGVVFLLLNRPIRKLPRIDAVPTDGGVRASMGWSF